MQPQLGPVTPRKLPVFVFPQNITFFLDDQLSHKQVLTLYNPYDFPVKFKVLCTAPNKYKVMDPEGTIKSRCCVYILIRHTALMIANCNIIDKFRVQMQEHPNKQAIGWRDVEARLLNGTKDSTGRSTPDPGQFQQLPAQETRQQRSYALLTQNRSSHKTALAILNKTTDLNKSLSEERLDKSMLRMRHYQDSQCVLVDKGGTNFVALIAGIVCIIGLLLPTEGDHSPKIPDYLHLSINFKLIFAFVLGMVTIIVLRL
ncbi:motile sperm domain-containing protein 1-like isoform X1 [Venturia canescens]|uniref:motile sperm domain-containing protein 1-like isoform X1 n=1 Tax=Venturia canescens TaxID=32260 RepID=UPI001C9CC503|nr:motile sperm domain-containing protein 1-like isoform X1 [Venturia canescens]XP_043273491.1 motile sperm domain-containing protein 1-like isoform X1 [Venturia canescens]